jgi:hypothetical protein
MQFFHAHANAHRCKQFNCALEHDGQVVMHEEHKAEIAFNFFDELLGMPSSRDQAISLHNLAIPVMQLPGLNKRFTEHEILSVSRSMPLDKAPSPDGFTARFLQQTWEIIRLDIMKAFDAICHSDTRSFHLNNDVVMVLLPKSVDVANMCEFHPISLFHIIGKLFSKVLATRLAPHLDKLIHINQSASRVATSKIILDLSNPRPSCSMHESSR